MTPSGIGIQIWRDRQDKEDRPPRSGMWSFSAFHAQKPSLGVEWDWRFLVLPRSPMSNLGFDAVLQTSFLSNSNGRVREILCVQYLTR
jgi:hypothetical protein